MSVPLLDQRALAARRGWLGAAAVCAVVGLAGCANDTVRTHYAHGKEYFSQKKYGRASQKMIADGQPVPKGGGQYLVGRAYTVAGHTYVPREMSSYTVTGMASWYGAAFHGRRTANGEVYDMASITAAHPTMPLPSYARVTNLDNGYSLIVRVNDRGPYHAGRVMDVSSRAADVLGFRGIGTARIKVDYVGAAPMDGSDDNTLLASLRTDGSPAHIDGVAESTMLADNQSAPPAGGSIFAALFGGYTPPSAPPAPPPAVAAAPPPPPAAPRPAAPPPPQPEAVQVAAAPDDAAPAPEPAKPRSAVATRQLEDAPLPPPRPFDLGKARSDTGFALSSPSKAGSVAQKTAKVLPPKRPELHASAEKALYFSEPGPNRAKRPTPKAFDKVIPPRKTADDD